MEACILDTKELFKAQLAKSKLQANAIFSELRTNDAGGTMPHLRAIQGIQLYVSQKDLQKAKDLLEKEALI